MKKCVALLLAVLTLMTAAAFAEAPMAGGWTPAESPEITEERQAVFDKAMEGLLGVSYKPVAYLGSQLVAGTNHCFLCQATVVYPDTQPDYVLVFIYQDLSGNARIMNIAHFDFGALCEYGPAEE